MSDFLINLAVRGAVGPQFPVAALPAPLPANPAVPIARDAGLEEMVLEQPAVPAPRAPRQEPPSPPQPVVPQVHAEPPTPAPARVDVPLQVHPGPPPMQREVRIEHREVVHEAAAERPMVEVRETVRETEVVRERVIEREIVAESGRPREVLTTVAQPRSEPLSPRPVEPRTAEIIRELVAESTTPAADVLAQPRIDAAPSPANMPERLPGAALRPTGHGDVATQPSRPRPATAFPEPPATKPTKATSRPQPKEAVPNRLGLHQSAESSAQEKAPTPWLRPAPPAAPAALAGAPVAKAAKPEQSVEVKIGSLEIRTAPTAPQVQVRESAPAVREPVEGFEQYSALRRYNSWFRE